MLHIKPQFHTRLRAQRIHASLLGALALSGLIAACSGKLIGGAESTDPVLPGDPGSSDDPSTPPGGEDTNTSSGDGDTDTDVPTALDDPGLIGMHRLNRSEYNNTVRDLLGTALTPGDDFPSDDLLYGFDNIGEALSVSTLLFEGYDNAAQKLITELFTNTGSDAYKRVMVCDVATGGMPCISQILQGFAERAWRRPVVESELAPYMDVVGQAATTDEGLALSLQTILISPSFMFRVELDPDPESTTVHPLNDFELASRMSYFLWGTMPDDKLFDQARGGALQTEQILSAEIERMLADSKADTLVSNMAGMWLFGRAVGSVARDYALFPNWDSELQQALPQETRLFFNEFYKSDLPVRDMLTANFTFVNQRLAQHYGLEGVSGSGFGRVDLTGSTERQGLLTQATFLTVTSRTNRTAPVLRGKWVLDQILCAPPAPPPPGVDSNIERSDFEGLTLRERLAKHKEQGSTCYSCHASMDPIGLGLENYDAVGSYRTTDADGAIDASGELPGKPPQPFNGAFELAQILASDTRFEHCLAQQLTTYGIGAKPTRPWVDSVLGAASTGGSPTVKSMIRSVVRSNVFRMRRAGEKG